MTELSLSERFSSCSFTPVTKDLASFSPIVASSQQGTWSATSYFLDSSGRSTFLLPLQLACRTKDDVDHIVASKCLQPAPKNIEIRNNEEDEEKYFTASCGQHSLRLEVQSHPVSADGFGTAVVTVESITILSTLVEGNSVLLDTQVTIRAPCSPPPTSDRVVVATKNRQTNMASLTTGGEHQLVKTRLEVTAVLANRRKRHQQQRPPTAGLVALELGGGSQPLSAVATRNMSGIHSRQQSSLGPLSIHVSIAHALTLSAKSVGGTCHGRTLVSLTMKHPNTHDESVCITNIALHAGHSRQDVLFVKDRSMPGGERSVVDMNNRVQWGYVVPETAPQLPLTLRPYEAYSVVMVINATTDDDAQSSRTFVSPISVTAVIGSTSGTTTTERQQPRVIVTTDAQWTTGRVAVEPSDAFRINLSLQETTCCVGTPFIVSLRIHNLGPRTRDLMLIMPKADHQTSSGDDGVVAPAVSELNGYTFGVWGLSGNEEDGGGGALLEYSTDQELLAMDAAVLLGEVQGQKSISADIRFVPLRDGPLHIPNFKLYEKVEGKWYTCVHKLCVVSERRQRPSTYH